MHEEEETHIPATAYPEGVSMAFTTPPEKKEEE